MFHETVIEGRASNVLGSYRSIGPLNRCQDGNLKPGFGRAVTGAWSCYSFIQLSGRSPGNPQRVVPVVSSRLGAITILVLFLASHAPHQLNVLLAMIKCLHIVISHRSLTAAFGPLLWATAVTGSL